MHLDGKFLLLLAVALAVTQGVCWLLARGLGMRLGRWAMAGGLLLSLALLAPWLDGSRLLAPCDVLMVPVPGAPRFAHLDRHDLLNDAIYQFLPWELEIRHALAARRLPFWSDLLEGGSSPWANPQAGVLSPLQIPARLLPIQHHLLGALALKILVAFEGTWLLARRVGRSRPSSLLAGAGFALGGGILSWGLFPHTAALAWVPWLATGVIGLFRHPRPRGLATTAALTAALLLSGHPEVAAIGGLFAGLSGLLLRRRALGLPRGLGAAALAALLGFGLAAPHLFPFLAILPDSQRAHEAIAQTLPPHRFALLPPSRWFLPGRAPFVLAPTNPRAFGRPFRDPFTGPVDWADADSGYTGLVAFAGALLALFATRDRRALPFLAFAGLGVLLAARFLPFIDLLYAVPPLRVPAYERFLLVGSLSLAVAAAFGTDLLLRRTDPGGHRRGIGITVGLAAAAGASLAVHADLAVAALWAGLALAVVLGVWNRRRAAAALLGLVLLLDLLPWGRSLLPAGHPALFYPRTPFLADLAREASAGGGPWRAVGAEYLVYPSLLPFYGIAEVRPHNPLAPMPYLRVLSAAFAFHPSMVEYFSPFKNVDHPLLDFLNARVVVGSVAMPRSQTLIPIDGGRYAPFFLYRNPEALPRWFVPTGWAVIDRGDPRGIERFIAGMADPARVALFADEVGAWRPSGLPARPEALTAVAAAPGHLTLALPAPAGPGGTLVATSIPASRGWRARAAGRPLATLTVDGAFLGVRVPPGTREIELRYLPPGLLPGLVVFLVAAAVVSGMVALGRGRTRTSTDGH
jgi:membrane protein YfhO